MYLLDTNCLSEMRRIRAGRADINVAAWAALVPLSAMYLSVITLFELQVGIARASLRDPVKAGRLAAWLESAVLPGFRDRIFPVDELVVRLAGPIAVVRTTDKADVLIAATAITRKMTLVTRNTSHFAGLGVDCLNPWIPSDC